MLDVPPAASTVGFRAELQAEAGWWRQSKSVKTIDSMDIARKVRGSRIVSLKQDTLNL